MSSSKCFSKLQSCHSSHPTKTRHRFLAPPLSSMNNSCPGCGEYYVGKTCNTLFNRSAQHGWTQKDSSVIKHFASCSHWKELVSFLEIGGEVEVDTKQLQINAVRENTTVVAKARHSLRLDFREAVENKKRNPELNKGLKSCKDLALF